ncbi:MAG: membrane protein insertase YidC [Treponema sp.]|nr:membrane protein insertase YidC [Treponema sp.]
MEKNTILAVVLSLAVIIGFYVIQGIFYPQRPAASVSVERTNEDANGESGVSPVSANGDQPSGGETLADGAVAKAVAGASVEAPDREERITIDNGLVVVTLSNAGGDIVSYKLKEHSDKENFVEMALSGAGESHAFAIAFGGINTAPETSLFNMRRVSDYIVEFYRDFAMTSPSGNNLFQLIKRYEFRPNEYMFELTITLDGSQGTGYNFSGVSYTLGSAPQFGPAFDKLDQRYEYRHYYTYTNGKLKQEKVNDNGPTIIGGRPSWAGVAGKYFTLIAIPYPSQFDIAFSTKPEPGIAGASRLYIIRPSLNSSRTEDTYRFYLGPKSQDALGVYNNGKNSFNLTNTELIKLANTSGILAPFETALKWLLMFFYNIIPNYGVAIILLTLLVKVIMFPLTRKSSESTLRMQALSPKIKDLQAKYKDNPQKLNQEMAEFYKKEGYNPMAGCLPMLIQIPIFFAMYNLFNTHFDLRGAMFISGWIPDLSLPEAVFSFPNNFSLPLLGWTAIRALPFIYVASQLLYGKITQTPGQAGGTQMKIMMYGMPVMFFFILYDVPSGLLIYWIMSNVLSLIQQLAINKYLAPQRAALATQAEESLKLPPKKKKKR